MKYTSAEASKLLRALGEKYETLRRMEDDLDTFGAFAGEDIESIRPEYDYAAYQAELAEMEGKVRAVKHAINLFNVTTVLPGTDGVTIDQALVLLPQLNSRKVKLRTMAGRMAKQRLQSNRTTTQAVSEFRYTNYDPAVAKADYEKTVEQITTLQTALDLVNNTVVFEIDI